MNWPIFLFCVIFPAVFSMVVALRVGDGRRRKQAEYTVQAQIEMIKRFQLANEHIAASLDSSTVLAEIVEQMCNAIRVTSAYICEFDGATSSSTVVAEYISPYASVAERVSDMGTVYIENNDKYPTDFKVGQPFFFHLSDPNLAPVVREHMLQYGAKSILYIPLQIRGARNSHVELWESRHHRVFSDIDIVLVHSIAQQAAITLDNAHLYEKTRVEVEKRRRAEADIRNKVAELATLVDVADTLSMAQTTEEIMQSILLQSITLIGADMGLFFLVDAQTDEFVVRCTHPYMPMLLGLRQPLSESGIAGGVGQSHQMEIVEKAVANPLNPEEPPVMRYCIVLPIMTGRTVIGALRIGFSEPHTFEENEVQILTAVTNIAANALRRVLLVETLEQRVDERTRDLADANGRLQEMDRLKSKLISDMSHELRTPVTNLQLYTDLMLRGKPEKQAYYLDIIKEQTTRLAALSESLLTMSRLDDRRLELSLKPINLNLVAQEAIARYETKAAVRQLALRLKLSDTSPFILADGDYLPRIVDHLMDNALNYTEIGDITIKTYEENGCGCLVVRDNGDGIAAVDLPHVFERFYRGQEIGASNIPGSGLGLSVVKDLVELHNGYVEMESILHECTCVTICIPLVEKTKIERGEKI